MSEPSERLTDFGLMSALRIVEDDSQDAEKLLRLVPPMVRELRERRTADLSAEDIEALRWARTELIYKSKPGDGEGYRESMAAAIATLSKLLARASHP